MNILVVGSGAREHAIVSALHRSPQNPKIFCYSQAVNPGIKRYTADYQLGSLDANSAIVESAVNWQCQMAIIGPEAPLANGLADKLWEASIPVIGPKQSLARIETSKAFARDLMKKYHIPGQPKYRSFETMSGVVEFLNELGEGRYVIKANGLMGGKGVKVAGEHLNSIAEAIDYCQTLFSKQQRVIIEEKQLGQEFSLMCFCDGQRALPMPVVQDHKRAFIGDKGPNTGGMGSYSDADHRLPFLRSEEVEQAIKISQAVFRALMQQEREAYIGILYGGFMVTPKGVKVIEFNARFGDPEALNVLSLLESDFVALCQALISGSLSDTSVHFAHKASVCKYAVPEGYPDNPVKNQTIDISKVQDPSRLYLAAVDEKNHSLLATGSRTAAYVGVADSIAEAEHIAEKEINSVQGKLFHRWDIGTAAVINQRVDAMKKLKA